MTTERRRVAGGVAATGRAVGIVAGLAITAASMSSGFIWASQGRVLPVYAAGFLSWTGYLLAHYAAEGVFVDDVSGDGPAEGASEAPPDEDGTERDGPSGPSTVGGHVRHAGAELRRLLPAEPVRAVGFLLGIALLVSGIATLAWFVRQENHLLGNVGSGAFLAGYVVAHYFDSGKLL